MTNYAEEKTFLEKIGTLFAGSVYLEGIIKDLLIFKSNPLLIPEINDGTVSTQISDLRKEKGKISFNRKLVEKLKTSFEISEDEIKLINMVRLMIDVLGHCRISVQQKQIWYIPKYSEKFEEICEKFGLDKEKNANNITIDDSILGFEDKLNAIETLDHVVFPRLAQSIGLKYENIR